MRKIVFVASALMIACGSSSSSSGGGGGPLAGTIHGHAFTPAATSGFGAVRASTASAPCQFPDPLDPLSLTTVGVDAIAVEVTSFSGACGLVSTSACTFHQNEQNLLLLIAKLNLAPSGAQPTLSPGTYTVSENPSDVTPDLSNPGIFTVAYAEATATADPSCLGTTHGPNSAPSGGTIRIDSLAGPITGAVNLSFKDGSTVSGTFSAPLCGGGPLPVCALAGQAISSSGGLVLCNPSGASCVP